MASLEKDEILGHARDDACLAYGEQGTVLLARFRFVGAIAG